MKKTIGALAGLLSGCTLLLSGALSSRDCGDGLLDDERGEVCDDGNNLDGDGCAADCTLEATCGDGRVESSEVCDDGNNLDGDGCAADCTLDCGDALLQANEQCDDGNNLDGDGCSALCALEHCGDGILDPGEQCDDNNKLSNDGCSSGCATEAELFVLCGQANAGGDGSVAAPFAKIADALDAATEGQRIMILPGSSTCAESVTVSKSLTILGLADPTAAPASAKPLVGNGSAAAFNIATADTTVFVKNLSIATAFNGGAVRVSGGASAALLGVEVTNTSLSGNASAIECFNEGTLLLDQAIVHDSPNAGVHVKSGCLALVANSFFQNNGVNNNRGAVRVEAGGGAVVELSTFDNNTNNAGRGVMECNNAALFVRADSIVANDNNGPNVIDTECLVTSSVISGVTIPGADNSDTDPAFIDAASGDFRLLSRSPAFDTANPEPPGIFDPVALFGVDVLSHDFAGNPRPQGAARDAGMFESPPCGDGVVDFSEDCEDNNDTNGDGCDNNCSATSCGNNILTNNEACDDGNVVSGDGCDSDCVVERCGDSITNNTNEECDDGNNLDGDGCDSDCNNSCGNGSLDQGEACDDGNESSGDGCNANCITESCGDALINNTSEQCDDGNANINDGCNSQCLLEPTNEQEPNEDGSPSLGGNATTSNDFATQNALNRGAFTRSTTIRGFLSTPGDEDVFAVTNPNATPVLLRVETSSALDLASCNFDSVLAIRSANNNNNNNLILNDDGGLDKCSLIQNFLLDPNQTVFVHVFAFDDNAAFEYFLPILFSDPQ